MQLLQVLRVQSRLLPVVVYEELLACHGTVCIHRSSPQSNNSCCSSARTVSSRALSSITVGSAMAAIVRSQQSPSARDTDAPAT